MTKRMAEDLCDYLANAGMKVRYMHFRYTSPGAPGDTARAQGGQIRRFGGNQPVAGRMDLPEVAAPV